MTSCTRVTPSYPSRKQWTGGWPGWGPGMTSKLFERRGADRGRHGEANPTAPIVSILLPTTLLLYKGNLRKPLRIPKIPRTQWRHTSLYLKDRRDGRARLCLHPLPLLLHLISILHFFPMFCWLQSYNNIQNLKIACPINCNIFVLNVTTLSWYKLLLIFSLNGCYHILCIVRLLT